jgi:hypothetical protein
MTAKPTDTVGRLEAAITRGKKANKEIRTATRRLDELEARIRAAEARIAD